jgi:AcrR family transcriptional regulator
VTSGDRPAAGLPRRPRTQAERRAETERRVLDAATRLVAARGVRAVTLAAVGGAAGYSRGIVTHHFGSRQGLLDVLTRQLQDRFAAPASELRGLDRLLQLVDAYLVHLRAGDLAARVFLVLWAEALTAEPDLRPVFAERDARFRATLAECLHEGITIGDIRPDVDPDALALALVGQLRGMGLQLLDADVDHELLRGQAHDLLERGLRNRARAAA